MKQKKRVLAATMKDVAKAAGVSTATVSRAFMTPEKVALPTLKKVEMAAQSLEYMAHTLNKNINSMETGVIAVIIPDIVFPIFNQIIKGIQDTLSKEGYITLLLNRQRHTLGQKELSFLFSQRQFAGVIFLNTKLPASIDSSKLKSLPPIVMANEFIPTLSLPTVHTDNLTAAFNAVSYLSHLGHQRIATICAPRHMSISQRRKEGYLQALSRNGIAAENKYILYGDLSVESGSHCLKKLMDLPAPPTAIFCHDDNMAIGVIYQAKKMGLRIPGDLSVIGFDDIPFAQYCEPAVTTVAIPGYQVGVESVKFLLKQIKGEPITHYSLLLDSNLLIRESTASVPY